MTAPNSTTTRSPNVAWANGAVAVTVAGIDQPHGSQVKEIHLIKDGGAEQVVPGATEIATFTTEGLHTLTFWAIDNAGNVEARYALGGINIDLTAPVVTIRGVTNGAIYFLHGVRTPSFTATDSLSGIATQVATLTAPSTASRAGVYTYVVTATDRAGNVTIATATYLVIYRFVGFLSPFAGTTFKRGRVIPVAFFLLDNGYAPVANARGSLYVDGTKVGDFIYLGLGIYYFNLDTSGLSVGRHTLTARLDDTTIHSVDIYIAR